MGAGRRIPCRWKRGPTWPAPARDNPRKRTGMRRGRSGPPAPARRSGDRSAELGTSAAARGGFCCCCCCCYGGGGGGCSLAWRLCGLRRLRRRRLPGRARGRGRGFPLSTSLSLSPPPLGSRRACLWDGFVEKGEERERGRGGFSLLFSRRGGRIGCYQIRFFAGPYESATHPSRRGRGVGRAVPCPPASAFTSLPLRPPVWTPTPRCASLVASPWTAPPVQDGPGFTSNKTRLFFLGWGGGGGGTQPVWLSCSTPFVENCEP